ncbi:LLM class F420-dependent oxidoreductase [Actinosynnema sp. NPDC020468]|uniref:LLM class F420-dependent oxidoreductase n=1 Tax=Actinosynnema sp. NPDC020468 TaxID=3154488 RepID=UPI0034087D22
MKFSLLLPTGFGRELAHLPDPVAAFETLADVARTADDLGFHALWATDHLHSEDPMFESWSTLTALARDTSRIRLGHLVNGNAYRNPALAAKMASTVDVLSHGRFTFGIGAGWYEPDHRGYGYEFGTAGQRLAKLDEAVRVVLSLWTDAETTFKGEHYLLDGAVNRPKGVQSPHIPLLIAGGGERTTLRLVARYADACNVVHHVEGLRHKYSVLRRHCDDVGRDYDAIHRTASTLCIIGDTDEEARRRVPEGARFAYPGDVASYGLVGTVDTIRDRIAAYEAVGVRELAIAFDDPTGTESVRRFAAAFL